MITEFSAAAIRPHGVPLVHSLHDHSTPVQGRAAPARAVRPIHIKEHIQGSSVIRWKDAGDLAQLRFGCRAIAELGGPHAYHFTVNLSTEFQLRAAENSDWIRRRVVHHVGPHVPMVLTLGQGDGGQLHVHAAIVCRGADGTDHTDEFGRIHAALQTAGGDCGPAADYQVKSRQIYYADGLAKYFNDNRLEAEPAIRRGRSWSMTNTCRKEAKRLYGEIREHVNGRTEKFFQWYAVGDRLDKEQASSLVLSGHRP